MEDQVIATLEQFYARGIAEGVFKPLDPDIARTAIFGMCFLLTMVSHKKGHTTIAAITRQLQVLASTGLLAS